MTTSRKKLEKYAENSLKAKALLVLLKNLEKEAAVYKKGPSKEAIAAMIAEINRGIEKLNIDAALKNATNHSKIEESKNRILMEAMIDKAKKNFPLEIQKQRWEAASKREEHDVYIAEVANGEMLVQQIISQAQVRSNKGLTKKQEYIIGKLLVDNIGLGGIANLLQGAPPEATERDKPLMLARAIVAELIVPELGYIQIDKSHARALGKEMLRHRDPGAQILKDFSTGHIIDASISPLFSAISEKHKLLKIILDSFGDKYNDNLYVKNIYAIINGSDSTRVMVNKIIEQALLGRNQEREAQLANTSKNIIVVALKSSPRPSALVKAFDKVLVGLGYSMEKQNIVHSNAKPSPTKR